MVHTTGRIIRPCGHQSPHQPNLSTEDDSHLNPSRQETYPAILERVRALVHSPVGYETQNGQYYLGTGEKLLLLQEPDAYTDEI